MENTGNHQKDAFLLQKRFESLSWLKFQKWEPDITLKNFNIKKQKHRESHGTKLRMSGLIQNWLILPSGLSLETWKCEPATIQVLYNKVI